MGLAYQGRGTAWLSKASIDEAIADFTRALERDPTIAWAYFNRGLALLVKGKDRQAEEDFAKCLALKPELKSDLEHRAELAREIRGRH